MEEKRRFKFKVGKVYKIHDGWIDFETRARYLGRADKEHVFTFDENNKKRYALLDKYWAVEIDGTITHFGIAPCGFGIFRKEEIKRKYQRYLPYLKNILKQLGERL